jgi:hypothetical protein
LIYLEGRLNPALYRGYGIMPLKKQLLLRALILLVLLPLINSLGLRAIYEYEIGGNIAYKYIDPIMAGAIEFIGIAVIFCGFGLFLRAYYEFKWKATGKILLLNVASALISYCSGIALVFMNTSDPVSILPYRLLYAALNFAADLVILGALTAAAAVTAKAEKNAGLTGKRLFVRGCIWAAVIFGIAGFIQIGAQTVVEIMDSGAPSSINAYIYYITPYLQIGVYSVIGAFIAWLAGSLGLNDAGESAGNSENRQ